MIYILCAVAGGIAGVIVMAVISVNRMRECEEAAYMQGRIDERKDVIAKINTYYGIKNGEVSDTKSEAETESNGESVEARESTDVEK